MHGKSARFRILREALDRKGTRVIDATDPTQSDDESRRRGFARERGEPGVHVAGERHQTTVLWRTWSTWEWLLSRFFYDHVRTAQAL